MFHYAELEAKASLLKFTQSAKSCVDTHAEELRRREQRYREQGLYSSDLAHHSVLTPSCIVQRLQQSVYSRKTPTRLYSLKGTSKQKKLLRISNKKKPKPKSRCSNSTITTIPIKLYT